MKSNSAERFYSATNSKSSMAFEGSKFQSLDQNSPNLAKDLSHSEDNVRIFIKIKPSNNGRDYGSQEESNIQLLEPGKLLLYYPAREAYKKFEFENILDENSTQEEVFRKTTAPLLQHCLLGYNATIFVYGQTGTGKTHTMGLLSKVTTNSTGIIPFTLKSLFDYFRSAETEYEQAYKW